MSENKEIRVSLSTVFLIIAIIVIVVMGICIYNVYNDKKIATNKVEQLNGQVASLENTVDTLQGTINSISDTINNSNENTSKTNNSTSNTINNNEKTNNNTSNTINNNNENTSITNNSKYEELTEEIYNQILKDKNEIFIPQNAIKNNDGTITVRGRVYEFFELGKISKEEYDSLQKNKSIMLFGEKFSIVDYEDFVPGYILKNANGYGFYVTTNYELINFNDTSFLKGTNKYYEITVKNTVKMKFPDDSEEQISESSFNTMDDNTFINLGTYYKFEFNNGKVEKIIYNL